MKNSDLFKNKLKCRKCGNWMFPSSVTVWGESSIFKSFKCSKCHQVKNTNTYMRFIVGDLVLKEAANKNIMVVYKDLSSNCRTTATVEVE